MRFSKIFITSLLLFWSYSWLQAQEKEESFIKASYVINFIEEIGWANESEIKAFKVGVLNDPNIAARLNELSKGLIVRGKSIKVSSFEIIPDITKVDLLVVSEAYSRKFERFEFLGKNCLIVSNNSSNRDDIMIDFHLEENQKVQFKLNTEHLKRKGFKPTLKLLVFGGQSSEVLGAFSESEETLRLKNEELKKRNEEIKEKELRIWKLGEEIEQKEADIKKSKKNFEEQEASRIELNEKLLAQKELISEYNVDIRKYDAVDRERQKKLVVILEQLKSQKADIDDNYKILANQKKKISAQEKQLVQKDSELKNSMIIVVSITLILLISR